MQHAVLSRRLFIRSALSVVPVAAFAGPALCAAATVARGTFTGASRHEARGAVEVHMTGNEWSVEFQPDFWFDGAPDPKVALGRDGYDPSTILGALASDTGAQSYPIPGRIDVSAYNEVWLWCERFNVPLGVAKLA